MASGGATSQLRRATVLGLAIAMTCSGCAWLLRVSSPGSTGLEANGAVVGRPSISGDGRYVAFASNASNLVAGDTNGHTDVFVRDMSNGKITRVSIPPSGTQFTMGDSIEPFISGDGRYVAFTSSTNNNARTDVYVRDRTMNTTTNETVGGDFSSYLGSVSDNGQTIGFVTLSDNMNSHMPTSEHPPFFTMITPARTDCVVAITPVFNTCLTSTFGEVGSAGTAWVATFPSGGVIMGSGFPNIANGIGQVAVGQPATTPSGNRAAFATDAAIANDDTLGKTDVYTTDGHGGYERDSVADDGSQANGNSFSPAISADGRFVAFESDATNLVAHDTNGKRDVFVRDRQAGHTYLVSTDAELGKTNDTSESAAISADGRYVAFGTLATNLDKHDTNGLRDVYVRDSVTPVVTSASPNSIQAGQEVFVTFTGYGFLDNPPPKVTVGDDNIVVGGMTVIDDTHVGGYLDVFVNARQGAHNVLLLNTGTGPSTYAGGGAACVGCLTITT